MVSTDVARGSLELHGVYEAPTRLAGVVPTEIRGARVERLTWKTDRAVSRRIRPGTVDSTAVARSMSSTMHLAADRSGFPCLVRRCAPGRAPAFAAGHRLGAVHLDGVAVPDVMAVVGTDVWMDRLPWEAPQRGVDVASVDAYVTSALAHLLGSGILVGTGLVHTGAGRLVCEDVSAVLRIEADEQELFRSIVTALVEGDPVGVADAVAELCRLRPPTLPRAAAAVTTSLEACWTPAALGLAIHGLGRTVLSAGRRSEPLVLLGDELLHRLDLAHEHRVSASGLGNRQRVALLASPA